MPPPSDDERPFLASIGANPDDEGARLIYADWLEERGDPRGAYMRLQRTRCALRGSDPQYRAILAEEEALLHQHRAGWGDVLSLIPARIFFVRGLLTLDAKGSNWVEWWDEWGGWVERLWVDRMDDATARRVAAAGSPLLWQLEAHGTGSADATAESFARFPHLRELSLQYTSVTDAGVEALVRLPWLETLKLGGTRVTARCLPTLLRAPRLRDLIVPQGLMTSAAMQDFRKALPRLEVRGG